MWLTEHSFKQEAFVFPEQRTFLPGLTFAPVNIWPPYLYQEGEEWRNGWVEGHATLKTVSAKESDHLMLHSQGPSDPHKEIVFVTDEPVDLSTFNSLVASWEGLFNGDQVRWARETASVSVATLTGKYYVRVHLRHWWQTFHVFQSAYLIVSTDKAGTHAVYNVRTLKTLSWTSGYPSTLTLKVHSVKLLK